MSARHWTCNGLLRIALTHPNALPVSALMATRRVGLWLIGAFGGVGSTVALGLAALARKLTSPTGLVTALPVCEGLDLDSP